MKMNDFRFGMTAGAASLAAPASFTGRRMFAPGGSLGSARILRHVLLSALVAVFVSTAASAQVPAAAGKLTAAGVSPSDYSQPKNWLCGPDAPGSICSSGLDAEVPGAAGESAIERFAPAPGQPVDCFYIYPTISTDPSPYADSNPSGEREVVREQIGRFSSVCRPFAPFYHQATVNRMIPVLDTTPGTKVLGLTDPHVLDVPYRDVLAAWQYYLAHYNKGRGVILVSHSQGSMLMQRLVASEIDGKPAQKLLVAAYMAGNVDLNQASFKHIPPCQSGEQTGCLVAWSTYRDTEIPNWRIFGRAAPGTKPICVNPAQLDGNDGRAVSYFQRVTPGAPGAPPFIKFTGQASVNCVKDVHGGALSAHLNEGTEAASAAEKILTLWGEMPPGFGMHDLDIALVQGNIINLTRIQAAAWMARH